MVAAYFDRYMYVVYLDRWMDSLMEYPLKKEGQMICRED